jgi:hypothetical protein
LPPSAGKQEAGKNLLAMSFWFLAWLTLWPRKWRQYVPLKCWWTFTVSLDVISCSLVLEELAASIFGITPGRGGGEEYNPVKRILFLCHLINYRNHLIFTPLCTWSCSHSLVMTLWIGLVFQHCRGP